MVSREGTATELRRRRIVSGVGLLFVFPIAFALALAAWAVGVRFALPIGGLVALVVLVWPLPHERIRITARRVVWRERLLGARFRAAPSATRIVTRTAGAERALLLSDGTTEHLVVLGPPEDVEALTDVLHEALARARGVDP